MPELVSATALLAMPPLMAYLAVRCLREIIPAWHAGGKIDSSLALHAFSLGAAIGALLMAAAYIFVNPFSIDMLGVRIAFVFGILAAASVSAASIRKHRRECGALCMAKYRAAPDANGDAVAEHKESN